MSSEKKAPADHKRKSVDIVRAGLKARRRKEKRFQFYGKIAIFMALLFLGLMFTDIAMKGHTAFTSTQISLRVDFDPDELEVPQNPTQEQLRKVDYDYLVKNSLRKVFPEVKKRKDKRRLYKLVSVGSSYKIQDYLMENPHMIGKSVDIWVPANGEIDMLMKGKIDTTLPESDRRVNDLQLAWVDKLQTEGKIRKVFNATFLLGGDSRNPEMAGILGAVSGSLWTMLITLLLSFPIGIATAIYLEEFAPQNKLTNIIEVNINNLAAVPSIVFGLLGLAVYINFMGLPRSAPLVGGLVLTLMTLPTIIISARASLKSVPNAIREAALGIGASKIQMVTQHVLPIALPGMLTGAIIGMAQALGETAPLLMIGMVAFIMEIPASFADPATVLPVQIFLWADSPERAFVEKTSGAIIVLLMFLILMNSFAVFLRRRLEHRF